MPSAGHQPASPRPSVFISYASEDRLAARALRDTLTEAGLDVWYDESDLGGGDAWDQKIRRQIRDCDYFMPLVSATTERRKEGYFRREWRLAAERTLDMADDVMFLLPVAIDSTSEATARVPDKFLSVQWLRAPGGEPTPALLALLHRLQAGEHAAPPQPATARARAPVPPPLAPPPAPSKSDPQPPPAMPPFPHAPEQGGFGHGLKFVAEVCWWILTSAWLLVNRLPRWARVVLTVWLVFTLMGRCGRDSSPPRPKPASSPEISKVDLRKTIKSAAEKIAAASTKTGTDAATAPNDFAQLGLDIVRALGKEAGVDDTAAKPVAIVPFARDIADEAAAKFATAVFTSCYGQMLVTRPDAAAVVEQPPANATDESLAAAGRNLKSQFVLTARIDPGDGPRTLSVRLLRSNDGTTAWSDAFPVAGAEPSAVATKITEGVLGVLPAKK